MPVPPPSFRRSLDEFVFINKNCLHRINAKRVLSIYSCCFASVGKHRIRKSSIVFQCNKVKRFLLLFSCLFFIHFPANLKRTRKKKPKNQMLKNRKSANSNEHQNWKTDKYWKTDLKYSQNCKTENPNAGPPSLL